MEFVRGAFADINHRIEDLETLQYQTTRITRTRNVTLEERWSFTSDAEGRMRIEYRHPESRIFVSDGKTFTAIDGLRVGHSEKLLQNLDSVQSAPTKPSAIRIAGKHPIYELKIMPAGARSLSFY